MQVIEHQHQISDQENAILELAQIIDERTEGEFMTDLGKMNKISYGKLVETEEIDYSHVSEGNDNLQELSPQANGDEFD